MIARLGLLLRRALPGGDETMLIAAYAIISTALVNFILGQQGLSPAAYYSVILLLSGLLGLNASWPSLQRQLGEPAANRLFFPLSAAIFLLANYLGLGPGWNFLPFLLFMVSSQAVISLDLRRGLGYSALLTAGWFLTLALRGASAADLATQIPSVGLGLIFTITLSVVLNRAAAQTARAERLAAELRAANAALAAARERELELAAAEERVRLAREIHDGLGHHLTVLNVQLQAAARLVERDPARAAQTIGICREEAQAALAEVRQSVAAMRRSPLDGRALPEAIGALVHDFDRASPLQASFSQAGEVGELAPAAAMTLYRAAQEGLTNAQKHAAAGRVAVRLIAAAGRVRVEVRDDGAGPAAPGEGGFGLAGLRERAAQLGGTLSAGPVAGGGFLLAVEIPAAAP